MKKFISIVSLAALVVPMLVDATQASNSRTRRPAASNRSASAVNPMAKKSDKEFLQEQIAQRSRNKELMVALNKNRELKRYCDTHVFPCPPTSIQKGDLYIQTTPALSKWLNDALTILVKADTAKGSKGGRESIDAMEDIMRQIASEAITCLPDEYFNYCGVDENMYRRMMGYIVGGYVFDNINKVASRSKNARR